MVLPAGPMGTFLGCLTGVQPKGSYWIAQCPAHDDRTASLSVTLGRDGKVLAKCHAGCTFDAIVAGAGLEKRALFADADRAPSSNGHKGSPHTLVDQYDYTDANGRVLFQVRRYEPKTFRQWRPTPDGSWVAGLGGVEPVLFRLPDVIEAVGLGKRIHIVEGEKDALKLMALGLAATTNPMGAGKWRDSMSEFLRDAPDVVVLPDNDDTGRKHAALVANSLIAHGATVRVVQLPGLAEKSDVSDWIDQGGTIARLEQLVAKTPPVGSERRRSWRLDEVLDNPEFMRPPSAVVPRLVWTARSTLLSASQKAGKSTLIGYLASQVSKGGLFLGAACQMGTVLIAGLEEGLGDLAGRLKSFGADPTRVHLIDRITGTTAERQQHILEVAAKVDPILVIVDTLAAYGSGNVQDENQAAQMQPLVQSLSDAAHRNDFGLLIAHHNNRAGSFRGSSAIGGAVDVLAEMTRPENLTDPLRSIKVQGRFPVHDFEMRYGGREFVLANADGMPLEQRVLEFIRVSPQASLRSIRESIGGRHETIDLALADLETRGFIRDDGNGHGCSYVANTTAPISVQTTFESAFAAPSRRPRAPRNGHTIDSS